MPRSLLATLLLLIASGVALAAPRATLVVPEGFTEGTDPEVAKFQIAQAHFEVQIWSGAGVGLGLIELAQPVKTAREVADSMAGVEDHFASLHRGHRRSLERLVDTPYQVVIDEVIDDGTQRVHYRRIHMVDVFQVARSVVASCATASETPSPACDAALATLATNVAPPPPDAMNWDIRERGQTPYEWGSLFGKITLGLLIAYYFWHNRKRRV